MSLFDRTHDALFQMQRYGCVFDENVAEALEALTDVNDDLHHGRDKKCIAESVAKVRAALDKIDAGV